MRNSFGFSGIVRRSVQHNLLFAILLLCITGIAQGQSPKPEKPPVHSPVTPLNLRPYKIAVVISSSGDSTVSAETIKRWEIECQHLLTSWHSGSWNTDFHTASSSITNNELAAYTRTAPAPHWHISGSDKTIGVTLSCHTGSLAIASREWDQLSQTYGPVSQAECHDEREFANEIATTITQAFRPIVELKLRPDGEIEGVIQAGEFPSQHQTASHIDQGDMLLPFLRVLNRKQELVAIQPIPWTYLQVTGTDRAQVECTMHSTFQSPFPKSSRRVSTWALRERPSYPKTVVTIIPRGKKQTPLAATRCELINITPESTSPASPRQLLTDRNGSLALETDPEHPLKRLTVFSGQSVLARVPIVVGIVPELELDVPDDSARLAVEGEIAILESELLDLVATREIVMARIRTAADQERWAKVDSLLAELDQLPSQQAFLARIDKLQLNSIFAAQQAKDRVAELRIKRMCETIRTSAQKHLDHTRLNDLKTNVTTERQQFEKRSM